VRLKFFPCPRTCRPEKSLYARLFEFGLGSPGGKAGGNPMPTRIEAFMREGDLPNRERLSVGEGVRITLLDQYQEHFPDIKLAAYRDRIVE
jgi:hypothetical protein